MLFEHCEIAPRGPREPLFHWMDHRFWHFLALKIYDFAKVGCHLEDHFQWNDQGRITGVRDDLWDIFFLIFATFLALKKYHFASVGSHLTDSFFEKRPRVVHEGERRSVGHFFFDFWHLP